MDVFFSIVIPAYNASQYIHETINSVYAQTFQNFELIVLNDGSLDNTEQIIWEISKLHENMYCYSHEDLGVAYTRNRGISCCKGKYVCFLDADDLWEPNKLEVVYRYIMNNPGVDLIWHWVFLRTKKQTKISKFKSINNKHAYLDLLMNGNMIATSAVTVRKSKIEEVGCFNIAYKMGQEDYDCWLKLARAGATFGLIKKPLGTYIVYEQGISSKYEEHISGVLEMLDAHFEILEKTDGINTANYLKKKKVSRVLCSYARYLSLEGKHDSATIYYKKSLKCVFSIKAIVGTILNLFGM